MEKRWIWPFELEDQIGAGAMGVVYRARFVKNDRRVALKLLPPELAANATLAARFQREMEVLKELRHPNIVHCFGGTCEGEQSYYAMELVDGGTVAALLTEQGRIPWRRVLDFGLQICAALAHSHAKGIIHRDLKPGNLLLTRSGQIKLSDYGLAMVSADVRLTSDGKTMGSLHYMAPEQIKGRPPATGPTDLYALGCVLFEMLTGRTVFQGTSVAELLQRHLHDPPPRVAKFLFDCPQQLDDLIAELLTKDPAQRPSDAQTVARRLKGIAQSVVVRQPQLERTLSLKALSDAAITSMTSSQWIGIVAGILLVVSIGGGCWMVSDQLGQRAPFTQSERRLVAALHDPNPTLREFAARTLGELGPAARGALPELQRTLDDPIVEVRLQTALALGRIDPRDPSSQASLRRIQKQDVVEEVRVAAANALSATTTETPRNGWLVSVMILIVGLTIGLAAWAVRRLLVTPMRGRRLSIGSDQIALSS
ncbi:MAG: protein kinase [Planctomycetales bacterium]|nr:protein kinase [Planctomycetales bacterium]